MLNTIIPITINCASYHLKVDGFIIQKSFENRNALRKPSRHCIYLDFFATWYFISRFQVAYKTYLLFSHYLKVSTQKADFYYQKAKFTASSRLCNSSLSQNNLSDLSKLRAHSSTQYTASQLMVDLEVFKALQD